MEQIRFLDNHGTFTIEKPENYSGLYFPIAGEKGIKSAITPNMGGDSKLNQNTFIMEPVSIENLHNNRAGRNFWCVVEDKGAWSAVGQSAQAEAEKFTKYQDDSQLTAGFMWQTVTRTSETMKLKAEVTSFVPMESNVEVMQVNIRNLSDGILTFIPVAAIPVYGRSADNIRDHRHVTSLLHRIKTTEDGVHVRPTLSFDERGHQHNHMTYFVCGVSGNGEKPESFYPLVHSFIGEGGTFTNPAVIRDLAQNVEKNTDVVTAGADLAGKEAIGGIRFAKKRLAPGEVVSYTVVIGATQDEEEIIKALEQLSTKEKVDAALEQVKKYWQDQVNVAFHTGGKSFDQYMKWVSFQPFLRRIYGCSFLPHHDYGKGGRGWRDLWQDCLALLMMNPDGVRQMIIDNFGGVRMDGTNATIIGEGQGVFIADRNNIARVWMDHGVWPFMTTKLYIEQTGDLEILFTKAPYFKDKQVERGTQTDENWSEEYGNQQKDITGKIYQGTLLEHLLLEHLCAFYEVGEHNMIRLRGADWNDALDMAEQRGESVAFTCAYAGNLKQLARYVRLIRRRGNNHTIELLEEILGLLTCDSYSYDDINKKHSILKKYVKQCRHQVSGAKISIDTEVLAKSLEQKADWMMEQIKKQEWVTDQCGNSWFNSYYDNNGRQVEGQFQQGIRMMLTGQVFALMSKTADTEQMKAVSKSAYQYLFDAKIGGYRINTDFQEEKYDMGRMFGFAYGEKENGAVFSHMTVMYANALYQNGMIQQGHQALQTLADTALDFKTSKMYPGIPEYFNSEGRGLYSYLTGAASWYLLTMITEVFGIKGDMGNLVLEPKLLAKQYDEHGDAAISLSFAGRKLQIFYHNPQKKEYGDYEIEEVNCPSGISFAMLHHKLIIQRNEIERLDDNKEHVHVIEVTLK